MPADHPWQGSVAIDRVEALTPDYFKLRFTQPAIAAASRPGMFVNVLLPGPELCLRRPISIHAVEGDQVSMVVGKLGEGTRWLGERAAGEALDLLGPLGGRGLSVADDASRIALVGGGVGIPPLHFLATRSPEVEKLAFVGARSADRLLCLDEFEAAGCRILPSTDDGTMGFHGTAVAAVVEELARGPIDQILVCGPTPMMRAAAELAASHGIPCQVCLEARMACAMGACLSCVVETTTGGWQKYQRVCTEGPVFDGEAIVWETLSPLCAL